MKAKTELLLYQCCWLAETAMRPTWWNLHGSFEEWAYRGGLLRQVRKLEAQGWLESRQGGGGTERLVRLTGKGLLRAVGGSDPQERWNRGWDGKWRMVVFDVPERERVLRNKLRKQLRAARFGGLQGSVWITPDPLDGFDKELKGAATACRALGFFEAVPCAGDHDTGLVTAAWDFGRLALEQEEYRQHLGTLPGVGERGMREKLLAWLVEERRRWGECMERDPLLPRELWPESYAGEAVWRERLGALRRAGELSRKPATDS